MDNDRRATRCESPGDTPTKATACAGHHGYSSPQIHTTHPPSHDTRIMWETRRRAI
jgi:hypothetical protein